MEVGLEEEVGVGEGRGVDVEEEVDEGVAEGVEVGVDVEVTAGVTVGLGFGDVEEVGVSRLTVRVLSFLQFGINDKKNIKGKNFNIYFRISPIITSKFSPIFFTSPLLMLGETFNIPLITTEGVSFTP